MHRWEEVRDRLASGRETAVLAAQDQLLARQAEYETSELAQFESELDSGV